MNIALRLENYLAHEPLLHLWKIFKEILKEKWSLVHAMGRFANRLAQALSVCC